MLIIFVEHVISSKIGPYDFFLLTTCRKSLVKRNRFVLSVPLIRFNFRFKSQSNHMSIYLCRQTVYFVYGDVGSSPKYSPYGNAIFVINYMRIFRETGDFWAKKEILRAYGKIHPHFSRVNIR